MAGLIQVDPGRLADLSTRIRNNSQEMIQLAQQIESALQGAGWRGQAYTNFSTVWDGQRQHVNQLSQGWEQIQTALNQWKDELVRMDTGGFRGA